MTVVSIRVQIPFHLQRLAGTGAEITLQVPAPHTQHKLLQALEQHYPTLRGAVLDLYTGKRRPMIRFFACQQDYSFVALDSRLPEAVIQGLEPFMIVGAISGG